MKCAECSGNYREKSGFLEVIDPYLGPIAASGIYDECETCGDILYTIELARAIDAARKAREQELLKQMPIGDFLSAAETASLLGISRQALNKHRRIRRGFIYHTTIGGFTVYLKKSVIQFKETGDGRFPLAGADALPKSPPKSDKLLLVSVREEEKPYSGLP